MAPSIWSERRFGSRFSENKPTDDARSAFQIDYDRLLFSTPVRRLSDKTQVWPMDDNDGVRTRLTHSHEVSNLARSIGTAIYKSKPQLFGSDLHEVVQPMLSAIGLAHDLGNPPFGHQGEAAIGAWFKKKEHWIFTHIGEGGGALEIPVPGVFRNEFLEFDGNPQTLRLLARLQISVANVGLDLTAGTLAASLKYPVGSGGRDKKKPSIKKVGYFESEREIVEWIREETGLAETQRHPLTWIMEACDDIAYSVLDIDDAMKKGTVSPDDVFSSLSSHSDLGGSAVIARIREQFLRVAGGGHRYEIARDIKIDYLRAALIKALIKEATDNYIRDCEAIFNYTHTLPLLEVSTLCNVLKELTKLHAFTRPQILRVEAIGATALADLLDYFWDAIHARHKFEDLLSRRNSPFTKYVFSRISPNYLEEAIRRIRSEPALGIRYLELRLLTDMVSGMTDRFAIRLRDELKAVT